MEHSKPLIMMPRLPELRETRNNHQIATARHMKLGGVSIAYDITELVDALNNGVFPRNSGAVPKQAAEELLSTLRNYTCEGWPRSLSVSGSS